MKTSSTAGAAPPLDPATQGPSLPPLAGKGVAASGPPGLVVGIAFLGLVLAFPSIPGISQYDLQVGVLVFFFALLGTSWSVAGGYGGLHSIGQSAFVGIGAYTSTLLFVHYGISPWLGLVAGMVLAAGAAVVVGWPCFRFGIRGDYFALVTVALVELVYQLASGAVSFTGGGQGIALPAARHALAGFQFQDRSSYYYVAVGMWLITVLIAYRVRRSTFGAELLACRDDEAAAERGGINVRNRKLVAFALSAALTAAGGTLYAQFILFISPSSVLSLTLSVQIVLMAVLGGTNSYLGGTVGALILVPASQALSTRLASFNGLDLAVYGVVLVVLVIVMPLGILGRARLHPRWRQVVGW